MARVITIQTNLSGGELDPKLKARVYTDRYKNALDSCINSVVLPGGGVTRRAGLMFTDDEGAVTVNTIPFKIYRDDLGVLQGYLIEIRSDNTIHFYTNGDRIGSVSIASPFTSDIAKIRFDQSENVLYLVHPDFPPQQLTWTSDTVWSIAAVVFTMPTPASVTSINRASQVATVVMAGVHGLKTGQIVNVAGADQSEYNGDFQITVISTTDFTYTVTGSPATPATGTITAGRVYWGTPGYPNCITFFEQRMILGGSLVHPQTVFGSESGVILNFVTGVDDSDPFEYVLAAATSRILHLAATELLIVFTYDKEITIQGGVETPLTPTNLHIKVRSSYGTREEVRPVVLDDDALFVTKHGKKVRLLSDRVGVETKKKAPDISLVSEHLVALGIIGMAHQQEPNSAIWMVTATGLLLSLTYDKEDNLIAWAQHTTDGLFKNVAVIPYNDTDQVWVAVERTINSITSTYIEVMDPDLETDCAFTDSDSPAKTVWSGLSHLEGETVDIVADGVVEPQQIVTSGQITLQHEALAIEVGLHYKSTVIDLPPEIPTNVGTSQGQKMSVNKCTVRLYNTIGLQVNSQIIPFRRWGESNWDEPVELFTGDKEISLLGGNNGVVTIEQDQPLPFTVLGIIKEMSING